MRRSSWNGFRTVLCAIDFSEPSRRALRHAAAVAAHAHGRLIVLFVNDPLLVGAAAAARPRVDLRAQSVKELDRFVGTTLGLNAPTAVERRVGTGEPADQILSTALDARADLIVLGSYGLTGLARFAFGSTTTAVLKRTPVPALVVPAATGTGGRVLSWPRGRIVAAVMPDRRLAGDVDAASRVAEWFGCSLLLVHVLAAPVAPAWLRGRLPDRNAHHVARTRRRLADIAASTTRVATRVCVLQGHPADAIASIAKRERAPLLMTTLRDRHHWFEPARGSLTYRVLTQASVPVLAYPPRWRPR
jgi:universal stress protein A